jgi:hypothetical protein
MSDAFEEPLKIAALLAGFERPWFVAGGWAIDLFLGRVTRPHHDIEIAIFRPDQHAIRAYLAGWQLAKAAAGEWSPWGDEWLDLPIHQIRARPPAADSAVLDIMLDEAASGEWRFRRNLAIRRPLSYLALRTDGGVPFLCPEVVLLYKSKRPRAQDEADFANTLGRLGDERRAWLAQSLRADYPDHPWLAQFVL